jgi:hypothetical protein
MRLIWRLMLSAIWAIEVVSLAKPFRVRTALSPP